MGVPYQIKDCEGFELVVPVGTISTKDIRSMKELEEDVKVIVEDEMSQKYKLYKRWLNNELEFYKRFYWVDGEHVLRIKLLNRDQCDDEKRIVVKITGSKSKDLLIQLKGIISEINTEKIDKRIKEKQPNSSQMAFSKIKEIYSNKAIAPLHSLLHDNDQFIRWKTVRILSYFKDKSSIEPIYNLLEIEKEEAILDEIMRLFNQFKGEEKELEYFLIKILKEETNNPGLRIKAIEISSSFESEEIIDALRNTAEFDIDEQVKTKAKEILKIKNSLFS